MTNDKFHRIAAYVLVVICSGLFILLWAEKDESQKKSLRLDFVQSERDSLAKFVPYQEQIIKAKDLALDSSIVRLSILEDNFSKSKNYAFISDTTIANDSLLRLFRSRNK